MASLRKRDNGFFAEARGKKVNNRKAYETDDEDEDGDDEECDGEECDDMDEQDDSEDDSECDCPDDCDDDSCWDECGCDDQGDAEEACGGKSKKYVGPLSRGKVIKVRMDKGSKGVSEGRINEMSSDEEDAFDGIILIAENDGVAYAKKDVKGAITKAIAEYKRLRAENLAGDIQSIKSGMIKELQKRWGETWKKESVGESSDGGFHVSGVPMSVICEEVSKSPGFPRYFTK